MTVTGPRTLNSTPGEDYAGHLARVLAGKDLHCMAGALQGHSHQHLSAIGEPARPLAALGAHYVLDDSPPSPLDLRAAMDIRGLSRERTGSRAPDIYRRAICERPHRSGNEERLPCERPRSRQLTQPLHIALLPVRQRAPWFGTSRCAR